MKRIIVIGCPGGGKSTFSRALADITAIPLYHLDMMYWNEDRTTVPKDVFRSRLALAMEGESWIIDGNYGSTMELRIKAADTVFFLDYSADICLSGVMARKGKPRSDMPWVEPEDYSDEDFIKFIENYERESKPKVMSLLERYSEKKIYIFHEREDADEYLRLLKNN